MRFQSKKKKLCSLSMLSYSSGSSLRRNRDGKKNYCTRRPYLLVCNSALLTHPVSPFFQDELRSGLLFARGHVSREKRSKLSVSVRFAHLNLSRALVLPSYKASWNRTNFSSIPYVGNLLVPGFCKGCNAMVRFWWHDNLIVVYYRDRDGMGTMLRRNWSAFCHNS